MKCCKCDKEVSIKLEDNQYPPAKWFGAYQYDKLKKLICADCIKKPENKDWSKL